MKPGLHRFMGGLGGAGLCLALGLEPLHAQEAPGGTATEDPGGDPALQSREATGNRTLARAEIPSLLWAGFVLEDLSDSGMAGILADDLHDCLAEQLRVMRLHDLPSSHGVPAGTWWGTCPDRAGCLYLLAEQAGADWAAFGQLSRQHEAVAPVEQQVLEHTLAVHLTLIDVRTHEVLPPVRLELAEPDAAVLCRTLELRLQVGARARNNGAGAPSHSAGPRAVDPALAEEARLAPRVRQQASSRNLWGVERGHQGQPSLRVTAGASLGEVGQESAHYVLTENDAVVEEYHRQVLTKGRSSALRFALGYGLSPRWELEGEVALQSVDAVVSTYREDVLVYQDIYGWTEAACASGEGEGCPASLASTGSSVALEARARTYLRLQDAVRPFLWVGARWTRSALALEPEAAYSSEEDGPSNPAPPQSLIRTWSAVAGAGLQYDFNPVVGLFGQVPLAWRFHTREGDEFEQHTSSSGAYSLEPAPDPTASRWPLTWGLELGLQLRLP